MTPTEVYNNIRAQCSESGTSFIGEAELYSYMTQFENELADEVGCSQTTDSTTTTVASTREYSVPSGTLSILRCEYDSVKLQKIDLTELDQVEGMAYGGISSTGNPIYYYYFADKIGLSPIPDDAKTLKLWIVKEPTDLDSSSSAFTIPSSYGRYIIDPCLARVYLKDDKKTLADYHLKLWQDNIVKCKAHWWKRRYVDKYMAVKDEDNYQQTDKGII